MTVRISYGAFGSPVAPKVIDFPEYIYRANPPDYIRHTSGGPSAGGVVETLTIRTDCMVDMGFRWQLNTTQETLKRNLKQWEQWARNGNAWTLALDSTNTVNTTITDNPETGDLTVDVADATGIVANRHYVIRNEFDLEVVKVSSIGGTTLTLTEPLNFGYFAGDRFRAEMFWPGRILPGDKRPILIEKPPLWYDVELRFMEDLNDL